MLRKIGRSSSRARCSASAPQGYQSTGLCACWRRYGLVSPIRRFAGWLGVLMVYPCGGKVAARASSIIVGKRASRLRRCTTATPQAARDAVPVPAASGRDVPLHGDGGALLLLIGPDRELPPQLAGLGRLN